MTQTRGTRPRPYPTRTTPRDHAVAEVARGGLANLLGAAFAGLAGFVVTWLVARSLGTVAAGAFFASTSAFLLVGTVAKLGTQTGLVYWTARLRARGQMGGLRVLLRAGLVPVVVTAVVIAVGMWAGATRLAHVAVRDGHGDYAEQLRLLAVFLPVAVLSDAVLAATRGFRAMRPTVLLDRLVRPGLQVGLLAALIGAGFASPVAFVVAWVGPYLVSAVGASLSLRGLLRRAEAGSAPADAEPGLPRRFWRFTAPRAVASVAQLAFQRADVLLLAGLAGLRAAAVYAVAGRFVVLGQFANQGISQAVQPRLAEHLAVSDTPGANLLYRSATSWLILAAWPIYLLVAVFSGAYLGVFGDSYDDVGRVVVVLAAAMIVATGCGAVDMVLSMAGRTSWNLANVTLALLVQLGLDVVLIPRLGPLGAAVGLATATVLNNIVPLAQVGLSLRVHPFGAATLASALLTVGCFGIIPVLVVVAFGPGIGSAALAVAIGGACYLLGLWRLRGVLRLAAFVASRRRRQLGG